MRFFHNFTNKFFDVQINLILIFALLLGNTAAAQSIDWKSPLRPCALKFSGNTAFDAIASDNERLFTLSTSTGLLSSYQTVPNADVQWELDLGSSIISNLEQDRTSLYVAAVTDGDPEVLSVRRISKLTGITSWQRDLPFADSYELQRHDNFLIALSTTSRTTLKIESGQIVSSEVPAQPNNVESPDRRPGTTAGEGRSIAVKTSNSGEIEITAVFSNDSLMFSGDKNGNISATDISGTKNLWKYKAGGQISNFSLLDGGLLASSFDNFLYYFDQESGNLRWKKRFPFRLTDRPIMAGEVIIVSSAGNNRIFFLEKNSGKIINQISLPEPLLLTAPPVFAADKLFIATNSGIQTYGQCEKTRK